MPVRGTKKTIPALEILFETGKKPVQQDFFDMLSSFYHKDEDISFLINIAKATLTDAQVGEEYSRFMTALRVYQAILWHVRLGKLTLLNQDVTSLINDKLADFLNTLMATNDADGTVNTLGEVLQSFATFAEGLAGLPDKLDWLTTRANLGVSNAAAAHLRGDVAYTRADLGVSKADTAQTKANEAWDKAVDAFNRANTAQTRADLGVSKADTAQTKANEAWDKGVDAWNRANDAQATANTGVTNAATAQTKANQAWDRATDSYDSLRSGGTFYGHVYGTMGTRITGIDNQINSIIIRLFQAGIP